MTIPTEVHRLKEQLFSIHNETEFENIALQIFNYQAHHNKTYRKYITHIHVDPDQINAIGSIPFLPIDFFKEEKVTSNGSNCDMVFSSSGTTGTKPSRHYVSDRSMYETSFQKGFELFYDAPTEYALLALLPSYLENKNSSLIYMMNHLINQSRNSESGFYLFNQDDLMRRIKKLTLNNSKFMVWGVSFALLELAEKFEFDFNNNIVIETGGMKGKRKEMVRDELHKILCDRFHVSTIHSEYGMTELFSQAYSKGNGLFRTPPWMKVFIRDLNDPFELINENKTGGINVIDLANIDSCSFIATQDLGKKNPDGSFEVLGRFDNSELRGCNLLI